MPAIWPCNPDMLETRFDASISGTGRSGVAQTGAQNLAGLMGIGPLEIADLAFSPCHRSFLSAARGQNPSNQRWMETGPKTK
jgi:hypothetical protein